MTFLILFEYYGTESFTAIAVVLAIFMALLILKAHKKGRSELRWGIAGIVLGPILPWIALFFLPTYHRILKDDRDNRIASKAARHLDDESADKDVKSIAIVLAALLATGQAEALTQEEIIIACMEKYDPSISEISKWKNSEFMQNAEEVHNLTMQCVERRTGIRLP